MLTLDNTILIAERLGKEKQQQKTDRPNKYMM